MELFGLACVAAYCSTALVVAVRMLRLASRTGESPELLIGVALLVGGAIGYPVSIAGALASASSPALALRLTIAANLALYLSCFAMTLTWCIVYHRAQKWAPYVVFAVSALLFVSFVDRAASIDLLSLSRSDRSAHPGYLRSLAVQLLPHLLNAVSGLHYYAMLRRRMRLGLADPVVANRIGLWASGSAIVVTQYSYGLATPWMSQWFDATAVSSAVVGSLGLTIACLLALAFFPPTAYTRWVRARAEA